jgi:hypothetical protein
VVMTTACDSAAAVVYIALGQIITIETENAN